MQRLTQNWVRRIFIYGPRLALRNIGETSRLAAFALLRPAATYLPRRWALTLADIAGRLVAASPTGKSARLAMAESFGLTSLDPALLAHGWLARPFRDYVIFRRILAGREDTSQWRIEHRGIEACSALHEPGQSVIVATGHFARPASLAVYLPEVVPKKLAAVVATLDRRSVDPTSLRLRLQFGQMMDALKYVRHGDVDLVEVGVPGVASRLLRHLKEPGNLVIIAVDPPWPADRPGSFERAFAGHGGLNFATGAARLSRMAQCPIVVCIPYLDGDRIILEWSNPMPPASPDDRAADRRVTDTMLDAIERALALRPTQYVLKIGHTRRWDPLAERWVSVQTNPQAAVDSRDTIESSP